MILGLVDEAVSAGARLKPACEILGLDPTTLQRWRRRGIGDDQRVGPHSRPKKALSAQEKAKILRIANSPEFRDRSPKQIVPLLADRGIYIASESTIYRLLRDAQQIRHRETSKAPSKRHRPNEHTADGPNQLWSWDITYLRTQVKGSFFYLYMIMDVWSRKVVGFEVHEQESADSAAELIESAYRAEGVSEGDLVLHSDNGSPMKGATMMAKLQDLGVARSFSRPSVSNDNPFSESAFRTAKYRPDFPARPFESLEEARAWAASFVRWYNTEHLHSSISFVTPADRHDGKDVALLEHRQEVYEAAKAQRPDRWSRDTRDWSRTATVTLNPRTKEDVKQPV